LEQIIKKFSLIFLSIIFSSNLWSYEIKMSMGYDSAMIYPYLLHKDGKIDQNKPGVTFEVMKMVAKKLNIKINFVGFPWKRALRTLKENEIDALFQASFRKERMDFGQYPMKDGLVDTSKYIMKWTYSFYRLKNTSLQWDGTHLKWKGKKLTEDKKIGAMNGYSVGNDLLKEGVTVNLSTRMSSLLHMLRKERLYGVISLEEYIDVAISLNPEEFYNIEKVNPAFKRKEYYLMLSHEFVKKYPDLSQKIWKEIENIRLTGEYQRILEKYTK